MKILLSLLVVAAAMSQAAGAGAAPSRSADLCSVAKSVRSSITKSGASITPSSTTSITSLEASLKSTYTHIKAAESVALANSPGSLKPHFERVFAFDNQVYAELSAAHWNILAFAKNAKSLEAGALKIKPDLLAIEAYFAKCKA